MIQMMLQAARMGISPQQVFEQNAGNPQIAQLAQIAQGKNRDELMKTAENMAKERGISLDVIAQQMGIPYR